VVAVAATVLRELAVIRREDLASFLAQALATLLAGLAAMKLELQVATVKELTYFNVYCKLRKRGTRDKG